MNIITSNLNSLNKLIHRLDSALLQLSDSMPLDVESFNPDNMDDTFLLQLDGFRARFSDLQDYMGHTIFPMICKLDEDESPAMPLSTRERNVLMERKGIFNLAEWQKLREIRNGFAHEYPDEHIEKALLLNAAWLMSERLIAVAQAASNYIERTSHAPD
ncbi:MAG: hypothetical protein M1579_00845 [Gammaproteobacteria bacterium]|nr:hypothetical protein [Gammaproteobacteria bacterium]